MGDELRWIGRRVPRLDGPDQVTGCTKYMTDLTLENGCVGRALRAAHPHADLVSGAGRLPGPDADRPHPRLALHTGGRPVKLHYSREESVVAGIKRHPFRIDARLGVRADGTLTAL